MVIEDDDLQLQGRREDDVQLTDEMGPGMDQTG